MVTFPCGLYAWGAARWLCYGSMTRARYSLERSSALLVSWLSTWAFLYAVPSTDRCIFRMCSKRCMRGRASAVFWGLVAASRSAMIAIHPGRISTITASWQAVRRRDDANQLFGKGMYTPLRLPNFLESVCSNALGGFKWHVVVSRSRLFLPVHVVRSSRLLTDWIMASFSMISDVCCRTSKNIQTRMYHIYHM